MSCHHHHICGVCSVTLLHASHTMHFSSHIHQAHFNIQTNILWIQRPYIFRLWFDLDTHLMKTIHRSAIHHAFDSTDFASGFFLSRQNHRRFLVVFFFLLLNDIIPLDLTHTCLDSRHIYVYAYIYFELLQVGVSAPITKLPTVIVKKKKENESISSSIDKRALMVWQSNITTKIHRTASHW